MKKKTTRPSRRGIALPAGLAASVKRALPPVNPSVDAATNEAVLQVLRDDAEQITRSLARRAINGNVTALRLCVERLVPVSRERVVPLQIEASHTAFDVSQAWQTLFDAIAAGRLTPGEALKFVAMFENRRKAIETADLEERIEELENQPDTPSKKPHDDIDFENCRMELDPPVSEASAHRQAPSPAPGAASEAASEAPRRGVPSIVSYPGIQSPRGN